MTAKNIKRMCRIRSRCHPIAKARGKDLPGEKPVAAAIDSRLHGRSAKLRVSHDLEADARP
jgi:hypothetical protein